MFWNKPKKVIINTLTVLSVMAMLISLIAITTYILWFTNPKLIHKFDKNIPNFYGNNIESLYHKAVNEKDPENKLTYYTQLHKKTKDLTQLQHFHNYKNKANEYLIAYYLKQQDPTKALKIAEHWINNNPNDFNAKFNYIKVLGVTDKKSLESYYYDLYNNYGNIYSIANKYLEYLISSNNITQALQIEKDFTKFSQNNKVYFMLYYIDGNQTGFNDKQKVALTKHKKEMSDHKIYSLELEQEFTDLKALRLDLDNVLNRVKVSDINISIEKNNIIYENLDFRPMNSISKKINKHYFITGNDAHGEIILPETLQNMSGKYKIKISLNIFNPTNFVKNIYLNNKEWKFFYDTGQGFNEKESKHISLEDNNENYTSQSKVMWKKVRSIRLDLPSYIGMTIEDIAIKVNHKIKLDSQNISDMNGLQLKDSKLTVTKSDPFLTIKFNNKIDIHSIDVSLKF